MLFIFSISTSYSVEDDNSRFHSSNSNNCIVCHPRNIEDGDVKDDGNLKVSNTLFTPYSSLTSDANIGQPSGSSKICLSCHDGTIAMDEFGGSSLITSGFSCDLSDNHPISFEYNSSLASKDGGLHDPMFSRSGLGGTIDQDMLVEGKLECTSCHDVHNFMNHKNLLIMSNYKSALCLTCHDK